MSFKSIVAQQYRENVNRARSQVSGLFMPSEGWIRTTRKALGLSGAQLGRLRGMTRASVSNLERAELEGSVTIKRMQQMAESMGCRFVYAVVPEGDVEEVIRMRALNRARTQVREASVHMALEAQALSPQKLEAEIERIANELIEASSPEIWAVG